VDGVPDRDELLGRVLGVGNFEGHAGEADLRFGASEPLAHRGRRDAEGVGDCGRVEAEDRLRH